jgi:hypothetical protein
METIIIKARNKSDTRFLLDFAKRIGVSAKAIEKEELEDVSLIEKEDTFRKANKDITRFKGLLTDEEADKYHQYLQKARQEWDRDI